METLTKDLDKMLIFAKAALYSIARVEHSIGSKQGGTDDYAELLEAGYYVEKIIGRALAHDVRKTAMTQISKGKK